MDKLKFKERCERHLDQKIEYLRINNSTQSQQKPFFCCQLCINQDRSFNINDYLWIKELIQKGDHSIINKWPPINKPEILDQLIELSKGSGNKNDVVQKIICFFENLKRSINEQIDLCQKNIVEIAETQIQYTNTDQIIKQYQQISKIIELRNNLLNNNTNLNQKETLCKEIINSQQNQSQSNNDSSYLLEQLLMQNTQQVTYNPSSAEAIQKQILNSIQSISLLQINKLPQQIAVSIQQPILTNKESIQLVQQNKLAQQVLDNYFIKQEQNKNNNLQISFNNKNQSQARLINNNNNRFDRLFSNIILNSNDKYIFRIKIDQLEINKGLYIGLLMGKDINNCNEYNRHYCYLHNQNECIYYSNSDSNHISQLIKGGQMKLSDEREVEFRISISEKIVHILDYPNYQFILGLRDQYLSDLTEVKNFRLCVGLYYANTQVTLTESIIVQSFDY